MKNLMGTADDCNRYILLLCQVIAITTVTLIVLNAVTTFHLYIIIATVTTLYVVMDNTLCYNNIQVVNLQIRCINV